MNLFQSGAGGALLLMLSVLAPVSAAPLDADVLAKVKGATVYLKVLHSDTASTGSGFFVAKNLVVTNAHVLRMLHRERPPDRVQAVVRSGEHQRERSFPAEVIGVDPGPDLAFLRLGKVDAAWSPPAVLSLAPSSAPRETLQVYILGFPLGAALAEQGTNPAITIHTGTISNLSRDAAGRLSRIQVNGNLNPGNSGGPIVTSQGEVIGVSVSTIRGTMISFAIPSADLRRSLAGRLRELSVTRGEAGALELAARVLDPLQRLREVSVVAWTRPKGAPAPLEPGKPAVALELERGEGHETYQGELQLDVPRGHELWLQARVVGQEGRPRLTAPANFALPPTQPQRPTSPQPALPTPEGAPKPLPFTRSTDEQGNEYARVEVGLEVVRQVRRPILDLVAPPLADVVFVIQAGRNALSVRDPVSFEELERIPTPQSPVSLWADQHELYVACEASRLIQVYQVGTRKLLRILRLESQSGLAPSVVLGKGGGERCASIWRSTAEPATEHALVEFDDDGVAHPRMTLPKDKWLRWAVRLDSATYLLETFGRLQGRLTNERWSLEQRSSRPLPDLFTDKPPALRFAWHAVRALPSATGRYLYAQARQAVHVLPLSTLDRCVARIPGQACGELPGAGLLVTLSQARHSPSIQIRYADPADGTTRRLIVATGDRYAARPGSDLARFVPGAERVLAVTKDRMCAFSIPCGPLAPSSSGPPTHAQVGRAVSFQPQTEGLAGARFELRVGPQGAEVDPRSGAFRWLPTSASVGRWDVEIVALVRGRVLPVAKWVVEVKAK